MYKITNTYRISFNLTHAFQITFSAKKINLFLNEMYYFATLCSLLYSALNQLRPSLRWSEKSGERVANNIIIIIITIIIISFIQGIYTFIPQTNYVRRENSVAAILLLLFTVLISLVSVFNLLYFYISTFRSVCVQCPIWLFAVVP